MIVAPLPELADRVALTAWTQLLTCTDVDETVLSTFRDAYLFHGPERLSPGALDPPGTKPRQLLGEVRAEARAEGVAILIDTREPLLLHAASILDSQGRVVRRLETPAGVQNGELELTWDRVGNDGSPAPPDTYIVQVDVVSPARDLTQSGSASFELTEVSSAQRP